MPPSNVMIDVFPSNVPSRNDSINFTCNSEGGPGNMFQWRKDGVDVTGETPSILQITSVDVDDGGEYTCIVGNSAGNNSANFTLYIQPYIVTNPQNQLLVDAGDNATFICEALAFPQPTYQWNKVEDNSFNYFEQNLFLSTFFGDEGSYHCIASIMISSVNYTARSQPGELISKHFHI